MATKRVSVPTSVKIGPYVYPVVMSNEVDELLDARQATGLWESHPSHRILIHSRQDEQRRRMSLWHECMHAACDLPGMWFIFPRFNAPIQPHSRGTQTEAEGESDMEELVVNTLAPIQVMILRDNPDLVAYLTAPDHGS